MNFDLVHPIRLVISILKFLGLWRFDNKWKLPYNVYSYILHLIFTVLFIASMWASVLTATALEEFSESLYMSLCEACLLAKVINILVLNKDAVHFFNLVEDKEVKFKSSKEMEIFKRPQYTFYIVARFYISASIAVVGFAFTVQAFGEKYKLPYPAWMPFDLQSNYWYAYGFQLIGMIVTCLANVSIDLLQSYFLHHLALIYRLIGHRLANLGYDLDDDSNIDQLNNLILKDMKKIIRAHEHVKRITTKCERFMSFPFFMQILFSALVLCFTGYQITTTSPLDNPGQFIGMVDFLLVMGLQIFLPCYYANQITIQSGNLSEALYNSNWIALPEKSKKLIYLYMEVVKEPVKVRSGKFFYMGLPIFSKTINNAYSYFAVLIRMKI